MKVAALAGGIGAGKFLRGLARVVPGADLTAIVNVADDVVIHGLHVSPDPDSVTYWLGDVFDRERGWGRRDESFRATEELRTFGASDAWFGLGDLDLATHLYRTVRRAEGATPSTVAAEVAARFGVATRLLPVTDDPVATRIDALDADDRHPARSPLPDVLGPATRPPTPSPASATRARARPGRRRGSSTRSRRRTPSWCAPRTRSCRSDPSSRCPACARRWRRAVPPSSG